MANDQYQIPQYSLEPQEQAQFEATQHTYASPEKEAAPYQHIKDIETQIFSYRAAALAMESGRRSKGVLSGLVFGPRRSTIRELVDEESRLGGQLFGKNHRFWLDAQQGQAADGSVADWYHSQPNPANPDAPIVLRFQTTPYGIYKLYEGREYAPSIQELETFVRAIEAYAAAILPLYPLDQILNELQQQEEQAPYDLAA